MKRLVLIFLVLGCLACTQQAQGLEWAGVEGTLGINYRVPVYASWGLQVRGDLQSIPQHDKIYQSASLGAGWYCGNRWWYATVGGIRNWFAPGNEALTYGLQAGASTTNGNIWAEGDGRFIQSRGYTTQYVGRYLVVRRFHPLMLAAIVEQRNINAVRIGPGIGLCTHEGLRIMAQWFAWRDIDDVNFPAKHTISVEATWYFPWPGEDAKKAAGYSDYLNKK
ncbi:MAG: hypothetical protein V1846_04090 [Candidatus Komeilibacteria bacterium]